MTIYYCDPINGNDANDGLSMATALKNFSVTGKNITAGNELRVKASPDSTSLGQAATWTLGSRTVTLTSAVTQTIDNCESGWVGAPNITASHVTSVKEGNTRLSITALAAFVSGLVAYKTLPSTLNLSSYQQISFWVFANNAGMQLTGASRWQICLCSDTVGAVPLDSFILPATGVTTQLWHPYTLDKGSPLSDGINSIALYALNDPGTTAGIISLDNIIACKAPSAPDSLTLNSLIGKNDSDKHWYPIKSINDTTIILDGTSQSDKNTGRGYSRPTETATAHKRECFSTLEKAVSATTTVINSLDRGSTTFTSELYRKYSGGWVNDTDQTGETWFDGYHGYGFCFDTTSYLTHADRFGAVRYYRGFNGGTGSMEFKITNCYAVGNTDAALYTNNTAATLNADGLRLVSNGNYPSTGYKTILTNCHFIAGLSIGLYADKGGALIKDCTFLNNGSRGIVIFAGTVKMRNCHFKSNASSSVEANNQTGVIVYLYDCLLEDPSEFAGVTGGYSNSRFYSQHHDRINGNHVILSSFGRTQTDSTTVRISPVSWKTTIYYDTYTTTSSRYPIYFTIAKIYAKANVATTVKAWGRRSHVGVTGSLVCPGGQIAGVDNDVVSSVTAAINLWQELTITFMPTVDGPVEIQAQCYATGILLNTEFYITDMSIT
jgi:hypothetical protein